MARVKDQAGKESGGNQLRAEAEKKVARSAGKPAPLKERDLDKLVHELRVHQVELEMQNEELRGAQEQIAKSRNDYADLYDFSPVGYLTFNGDALITGLNLTGAALLGVERRKLLKRRFRQFVAPADAELWDRHFVSVLQQGEKQSCDLLLRRNDGSTLHARLDSIRVEMDDGTFVVRTGMSDITIQKQAEEALRESEEINRRLADYYKRLNDISITFGKAVDTADLFSKIAENFRFITDAIAASFSVYDQEARVLKVMSLSIDPVSRDSVISMFGTDLFKLQVPVSTDDIKQMLTQHIRRPKDLHELSSGQLPGDISDSIMDAIDCRQIVALAISYAGEIMGTCIAYLRGDQPVVPDDALKTYIQVSALAVKRKRAEEALKSEQIMLERTEGIAHVGSWEWDIATDTVTWSEELFRIFQRDPQEGAPSFAEHPALFHPDDFALLNQCAEAAIADGTPYKLELRAIRKDGETRVCVARGVAQMGLNGRASRLFGSLQDITERKKAEEVLQKSEARYRLLAEHTTDVIRLLDMDLKTTYLSPSAENLSGFTLQEMVEMPLQRQLTPESLRTAYAIFSEEISRMETAPDHNPIITLDLEYYCKDGTTIWTESKFSLIRDENGRALSILAEARDITKRKRAEKELQTSEAQYRLLAEHTNDMIWLMDMNLKTVYLSPSTEKISGFTSEERMELTMEQSLTPESLKLASDLFLTELPRVEADPDYNPIRTIELEYYCKDGTTKWTEDTFSVIRDKNGKPEFILAEAGDITERKQAEEKLADSYEALKKTLNDAINTIVKIVETRDPYTAGHQHKVAELAVAIAMEMEFDDIQIDQLKTAAMIHDIGKMYVPSDILSKPGKLTDIEFHLIKTHAQAGFDIVKGMDFPGAIAETVLQHHERLDGTGYPNGLKAEDTLMKAKILAVADVVEAMSSHRPYRPALGVDKALEEISKNRGKIYEPEVVDACLRLFNSGKFEFKSV